MLVMEALQWANETLKRHADRSETGERLDSPMLDAEVLLATALRVQKSWLFTHFGSELTHQQEERFHSYVKRRSAHEPVAYIVGSREFFKRQFAVNRFTLIPRPATETLVTLALQTLDGATTLQPNDVLFADIGTGSGAIAVTLAAETRLPVIATDKSRQALTMAAKNATAHQVENLIDFRHGSLFDPIVKIFSSVREQGASPFHRLIVCANLPYLSTYQMETAQPEVREFEPHDALVAGRDGLDCYWNLFRELKRHRTLLPERMTVLIEIDPSQRLASVDLIRHDFPHARPTVHKDLEGFDRVVIAEL